MLTSPRILLLLMVFSTALWFVQSVVSQDEAQVGYALMSASDGSAVPAASALFSFFNSDDVLISEAGIEAVEPISRGRLFVELGATTRTGLALANVSNQSVTADLILRDRDGVELDRKEWDLAAGRHSSVFVDEIFTEAPDNLTGSLTFDVRDAGGLAPVTIRESRNAFRESVFATLPVTPLESESSAVSSPTISITGDLQGSSIVFPQVGTGDGLTTQIILINSTAADVTGRIEFFLFDSEGLRRQEGFLLDGIEGTSFPFQLKENGVFRQTLTSTDGLASGYAMVTVPKGKLPSGTAVFQFRDGGGALESEAGVRAVEATTAARILVDTAGTQTGVALASPNAAARVEFELLDRNGQSLQTVVANVDDKGHLARFIKELFPAVEENFLGQMEIRSDQPIVPVTLKLTANARGARILTTLPLADLQRPKAASQLVIPQLGYGVAGGIRLSTRLVFINFSSEASITGTLVFRQPEGGELIPPGEPGSSIDYQIGAGSLAQLQEGAVTLSRVEILNLADPSQKEIVINAGNQLVVNATGRDTFGRVQAGVAFSFSNLDSQVAQVSTLGVINALERGFSTLCIKGEGVEREVTVTVQEVSSSPPRAFSDVRGIQQDLAGRVYLAVGGNHTIVRFETLTQEPQLYAGIEGIPGFDNETRLNATFFAPAFLSLDQSDGRLFVSDSLNHVIRVAYPGDPDAENPQSTRGKVETFAGTGVAGSADGPREEASFNNPQGLARFGGGLWIADSGNHTIRRIDLSTGMVETVAGLAGSPGSENSQGVVQARFNTPTGLAAELREGSFRLIVADTGNGVLRRVFQDGLVETVGATASQTTSRRLGRAQATFAEPTGVAVDPFGNIFVSEAGTGQVKTLLTNGDRVEAAQAETFENPRGLTITQSGRLLVAEENGTPREIVYGAPELTAVTVIDAEGRTVDPPKVRPTGGAEVTIVGRNFAPDSAVVIAGVLIQGLDIQDTQTIRFVAPALPSGLRNLTVQNRGGLVQTSFLIDAIPLNELAAGYITTVAGGTTFAGDGLKAAAATLDRPHGVVVDGAGNLFIADTDNHRIRKVDRAGIITTVAGTGEEGFPSDGETATAAALHWPTEVAVDGAGNLFIADEAIHRIRKVDGATKIITTVAGTGVPKFSGDGGAATAAALANPSGVAVDGAGNLFIADLDNYRIRKVDGATKIITTVAGTGQRGSFGDGGAATAAALNWPYGVAVDGAGNLFIVDARNHRIRAVRGTKQP